MYALLIPALGGCAASATAPAATVAVFQPVPVASGTPAPPALASTEVSAVLHDAVCWYDDPALARTCLPPDDTALSAFQRMTRSDEPRFIAPLVDMLWLDVGWERPVRGALEALTGQRFATPAEWYAWMTANPPPLPTGYASWKGRLLSIVDTGMAALIRDTGDGSIGPEQLVWGLVAPDAQPPLTGPKIAPGADTIYLGADNVVFGVAVDGVARAYPQRIIAWHEVVADTVGDQGIIVLHCTPCGGAAAFKAQASDGKRYTLRPSGLVLQSRRLLADDETRSLWDSVSGKAISGPAAAAGVHLEPISLVRTSWATWAQRHGETSVLTLDTGYARDYGEGTALRVDAESEGPMFPVAHLDDRLPAKTRVIGVSAGGAHRAYPLDAVERAGVVRDRVGGESIVLLSMGPGRGATAYDATDINFDHLEGSGVDQDVVDSSGQHWFVSDERLQNARNSRVRLAIPSQVGYWFAWAGAFPDSSLGKP